MPIPMSAFYKPYEAACIEAIRKLIQKPGFDSADSEKLNELLHELKFCCHPIEDDTLPVCRAENSSFVLRGGLRETYEYKNYIRSLLHEAAEAENKAAFSCLLAATEYVGILWEAFGNATPPEQISGLSVNDIRWAQIDETIRLSCRKSCGGHQNCIECQLSFLRAAAADPEQYCITQKPDYLRLITERFPIENKVFEARRLRIRGVLSRTNAPVIYCAILNGDIPLLQYCLRQGIPLDADCGDDSLLATEYQLIPSTAFRGNDRYKNNGQPFVSCQKDWEAGHTGDGMKTCRKEGGYYITRENDSIGVCLSAFHDPLTAAILSQDTDMINCIAEMFPEITWNGALEQSIVHSGSEITALLLEKFPEILDYISPAMIYEGKNVLLLEAYLGRGADLGLLCEDLSAYLAQRQINPYSTDRITCWLSPDEPERAADFYRLLTETIEDNALRHQIRMDIFYDIGISAPDIMLAFREGELHPWDIYPAPTGKKHQGLAALFHELSVSCEQNFTECLLKTMQDSDTHRHPFYPGLWTLRQLGRRRRKPFLTVDLYENEKEWMNMFQYVFPFKTQDFRLILKNAAPARILPRTDVFNQALLKHKDPALVRYAVKQGYITRMNALALYDEAAEANQWEGEKEKISEEILLLLIQTANGMRAEEI